MSEEKNYSYFNFRDIIIEILFYSKKKYYIPEKLKNISLKTKKETIILTNDGMLNIFMNNILCINTENFQNIINNIINKKYDIKFI